MEHAIINGVVVGNITASNSVQITETGRMVGDIAVPRVIIVDGARFRGNVDMGELEEFSERQPTLRLLSEPPPVINSGSAATQRLRCC